MCYNNLYHLPVPPDNRLLDADPLWLPTCTDSGNPPLKLLLALFSQSPCVISHRFPSFFVTQQIVGYCLPQHTPTTMASIMILFLPFASAPVLRAVPAFLGTLHITVYMFDSISYELAGVNPPF